jgi:two-component system sensor histidine kinase/response regulator
MREKGKGLGLWVVYHFIHQNGGAFFFESEENVGSRFGFRIPLMDTASNR